jgi:hypothetical protein
LRSIAPEAAAREAGGGLEVRRSLGPDRRSLTRPIAPIYDAAMSWQVYLSGEIHTDWRERIEREHVVDMLRYVVAG